jgi:hypothetical protein
VLPQHFEQRLLDLQRVDRHVVFLELGDFVLVKLHELNVWVPLDGLEVVVDHFVVVVYAVNVLQQLITDSRRASDRLEYQ